MQVLVFEDALVERLMPLVGLKPVYALTSGLLTLREKFERRAPSLSFTYHLRRSLAPWYALQAPSAPVNRLHEEDILLLNGRLVSDERLASFLSAGDFRPGTAWVQQGQLLLARVPASMVAGDDGLFPDLFDTLRLQRELRLEAVEGFRLLSNLWDPIAFHEEELRRDAEMLPLGRIEGELHPSAVVTDPSATWVAPGAVVRAGAVLDADGGFVSVGPGAVVEPLALLMQNVHLGEGARVKAMARVYSNVSIGRRSKVGGEVEDSIVEGYANKQHDGFLGHSYLSSWCNLGAGTTTSDLKNTYGPVRIVRGGREEETGQRFLGLMMGEHTRSAIGTLFNTGTVAGFGCNIFGAGLQPKEIPSFAWGGSGGFAAHEAERALQTARTAMARRQVDMSTEYEAMFRSAAAAFALHAVSV
ncbi:GlmU family protein [Chlorobium sp. N1]|uniref:GlmU family protein n=1 Tax=Chlorobium sp. N1 TaxID=2491138 RepID=UPI00103C766C|nr:GlmU family protein [Chlorobium sp. N1]TCD47927.1 transferase [Chlorobium sp. N1]